MSCTFTVYFQNSVKCMIVFCSSLISCFPSMSLKYFRNDSEMVPVAPSITGITNVFPFHMRWTSIVRYLYFRIFLASFLFTFTSPEIVASINIHVPFSWSWIMMSSLQLRMVLSVCTCWFYNTVTLPSQLVSTNSGTYSDKSSVTNFTPVSLHMSKCS